MSIKLPGDQPSSSSKSVVESPPNVLDALKQATGPEILALLCRFGMIDTFVRHLKEREIVFNSSELSDPSSIHTQAFDSYCSVHGLKTEEDLIEWSRQLGMSRVDLVSESIHAWRLAELKDLLVTASGESLFLRYKDKLDRVLYSLIRVKDPFQAQELYYSIEAGEITFSDASVRFSSGPEAKTQGLVGPVDLTTPHPEIAARLRTAQPGYLFPPFLADEWSTIIRLEYRFDSEYDDKTKAFLEDICFKSQVGQDINEILADITSWISSQP